MYSPGEDYDVALLQRGLLCIYTAGLVTVYDTAAVSESATVYPLLSIKWRNCAYIPQVLYKATQGSFSKLFLRFLELEICAIDIVYTTDEPLIIAGIHNIPMEDTPAADEHTETDDTPVFCPTWSENSALPLNLVTALLLVPSGLYPGSEKTGVRRYGTHFDHYAQGNATTGRFLVDMEYDDIEIRSYATRSFAVRSFRIWQAGSNRVVIVNCVLKNFGDDGSCNLVLRKSRFVSYHIHCIRDVFISRLARIRIRY
jgi:hypothetical protein